MSDGRAALEEAAEKFWHATARAALGNILPMTTLLADFAEQESSSLKLLLSAMCKGKAEFARSTGKADAIGFEQTANLPWKWLPVELDSSGIPVLTQEILEALEAAK